MDSSFYIYIVVISMLMVMLATYETLSILNKVIYIHRKLKLLLLVTCAIVMSSGIWFVYFIRILTTKVNNITEYDVKSTYISILVTLITVFISLYIMHTKNINPFKILVSSLIISIGITNMHYTIIEQITISPDLNSFYFILSIISTFITSYIGFFLLSKVKNTNSQTSLKSICALSITLAICLVPIFGLKTSVELSHSLSLDSFTLLGLAVTTVFILISSWATMSLDLYRLEDIAYKDTITLLSNRNGMVRFFNSSVANKKIAILFLDLDKFKFVNDTFGHTVGDLLIQEIGKRLRSFIQKDRGIFRIGGDEFLIAIRNGNEILAQKLATEVLDSIKKVYIIEGHQLSITGSIGISFGLLKDGNYSILLKAADTAMYQAKELGKNQYYIYNEAYKATEDEKTILHKDLNESIIHKQFDISYQPQWHHQTKHLHGFNVLPYWKHPKMGNIPASTFIPIVEETSYLTPITKWILQQACAQCKSWQTQGINQPIIIDISMHMFSNGALPNLIKLAIEEAGISESMVIIKVKNLNILYSISDIIQQIQEIRAFGVEISLADLDHQSKATRSIGNLPPSTVQNHIANGN